jgi:hypothetical protein
VIGKGVVVVLVIAARVILVDEDLDAVVVPVLHERITVAVEQDVINDFDQDVDSLLRPRDLETAAEILCGVLGSQPQVIYLVPLRGLPYGLVRHPVDDRRFGGPGCKILVAVFVVRRIRAKRWRSAEQQAATEYRRSFQLPGTHCSILATATNAAPLTSNTRMRGPRSSLNDKTPTGLPGRQPKTLPSQDPRIPAGTVVSAPKQFLSLPRTIVFSYINQSVNSKKVHVVPKPNCG